MRERVCPNNNRANFGWRRARNADLIENFSGGIPSNWSLLMVKVVCKLTFSLDHAEEVSGRSQNGQNACELPEQHSTVKLLILDLRIINCIRKNTFIEFDELKTITYSNAIAKYERYLEIINKVANEINAESDQVEMFLFMFGNNLSELKGEEYYGNIDDI